VRTDAVVCVIMHNDRACGERERKKIGPQRASEVSRTDWVGLGEP